MNKKHYSPEQWADYVRDAAPQSVKEEMKKHLDSGCKKCQGAAQMWSSVAKVARKEPGYRPSEGAVRTAKSYYAMSEFHGKEALVPRLAKLVFDSFQQPQVAGIRSMSLVPRHYIYQSGTMLVDVWTQPATESNTALVTGQVLDRTIQNKAAEGVMVKLRSEDSELSATQTNQFGEFHFEIQRGTQTDMQLTIGKEKRSVLIPLKFTGVF